MATKLMIACFVALGLFAISDALKCHVCTYDNSAGTPSGDAACQKELGKDFSVDCDAGVLWCEKNYIEDSTSLNVTRACGGSCTKRGTTVKSTGGVTTWKECCPEDNCNGPLSNTITTANTNNTINTDNPNSATDNPNSATDNPNSASFLLPALSLLGASLFLLQTLW